jgi:hypothetical protein
MAGNNGVKPLPDVSDSLLVKGFIADVFSSPAIIVGFKFNPTTIQESKSTNYVMQQVPGLSYSKYHWTGGGEHTLSFELFLDGYEQSTSLVPVPFLTAGIHGEIANLQRLMLPRRSPTDGAFLSRVGSAFAIDANSWSDNNDQFKKPPTAIFGYGSMLYDVIIKNMVINTEMVSRKLDPVRARVAIQLTVIDNTPLAVYMDKLRIARSLVGSVSSAAKTIGSLLTNASAPGRLTPGG